MLKYDDCLSIIEMGRKVLENQEDDSSFIDADTVNKVKNEFPLFLETAKQFWPGDFEEILTPEEEERARDALANIITNAVDGINTGKAYADDTITLIMTAAMMIERSEE